MHFVNVSHDEYVLFLKPEERWHCFKTPYLGIIST